jgi:vacuolar-type H+-ATPase catalytic subunit A/Vma1
MSMKIKALLLVFCLSIVCAACVNSAQKNGAGVKLNPIKNNDASEFLSFAETFSNLPLDAQKKELAATNQALSLNPNDLNNRMKLVMIYGLPSSNLADLPKAQNLLQQLLQENILANAQLAFAHVMFDYLVANNKANKNNHDDQKRVELLQQKNEALQLKLEAAQQKLDEIKNIEKSMGERELNPKK